MKSDTTPDADSFVLPAQTVRGSRQEMLATIDQAIVSLLALRHVIAGDALVVPGTYDTRTADRARKSVPTSMAQVGRILSNLMHGHD
jgi:hypothetical protein